MKTIKMISRETNLSVSQVSAVAQLLNHGATIPFIARYRKELTGSLDEVVITGIRDRIEQLNALDSRKETILKSLTERDLLSKTLLSDIQNASSMTKLEDLYEKYRPKKRTRAQIAREKGLDPLAVFLLNQTDHDPLIEAEKYFSPKKKLNLRRKLYPGHGMLLQRPSMRMSKSGLVSVNYFWILHRFSPG